MLFLCLLEQQGADRGQCKGRIFFEKKCLTFGPGYAIIMTERERTRKEDKKMAYGYYEAHEAEWEAMQEYLQNPED